MYLLRASTDLIKENGFYTKMVGIRLYLKETKTDAHSADDLALLAKTPVQTEYSRHRLD